ncbi:MAG: type VI secretion system amidase effector protein Tae4 [Flavobacterium circumlabens]|uniref:type VI secretion system amidase effector protein Tae4 n=1 Tax=Flavobacterium circumlabens TaxID=2133765 RepID=UPI003265FAA7
MMKKIRLGIVSLSLLVLLSNCNEETFDEPKEVSAATAVLSGIKQEDVTLDDIKNDDYLGPVLQKASKKVRQNKSSSKNPNPEIFNLDVSNAVKKFVLQDYTSYTIPILNDFVGSYVFQNLVIEKDKLRDAVYLVTYYPDENYQESIKQGLVAANDNIDFTGSKKMEYLYYKRKVNIDERTTVNSTNKKVAEAGFDDEIDEPLTICVETYQPKTCTAGGNHQPGEPCNGSSGQQPGWIVSVSCTNIPSPLPPPIGPKPGSVCSGCAEPGGPNRGGGNYFPKGSDNPNWAPKYICVKQGANGGCAKMEPYIPILTIPMDDPHNYYASVLSRDKVDLLLGFHYQEARKSIDYYLKNNKTPKGGYSPETRVFVNWALDYFKNNPTTTFKDFDNWFMGIQEGSDGGVPFDIHDYDGVQVQKQKLPGRNAFYNAFPKNGTAGMKSPEVYELVGGHMLKENKEKNENYDNACAIRVSRGLNYSGKPIPVFRNKNGQQRSEKGSDGLNYILDASSLLSYMLKAYSDTPPLHLKNKTAQEYEKALNGKWGIYIMVPKADGTFTASGHADFFSQSGCLSACYFNKAAEIYFWELK